MRTWNVIGLDQWIDLNAHNLSRIGKRKTPGWPGVLSGACQLISAAGTTRFDLLGWLEPAWL